jgi:hypothetical protein
MTAEEEILIDAHLDTRADLVKQPWAEIDNGLAHFGRVVGVGIIPGDPPWISVKVFTNTGAVVIAGTTVALAKEATNHLASALGESTKEGG